MCRLGQVCDETERVCLPRRWSPTRSADLPVLQEIELRGITAKDDENVRLASNQWSHSGVGWDSRSQSRSDGQWASVQRCTRRVCQCDILAAGTDLGVGLLNLETDEWLQIGPDALPNTSVRALAIAPENRIWIGTDGGLFMRKLNADGTMVDDGERVDLTVAEGLLDNRIYDLAVLPDGRVAAATRGGVFIGDGSGDPKTFTYVDGVPGMTAYNLVVDPDGALWIRSDAGLARLEMP